MNINAIFGIMGLMGGILCAVGDLLFDLKGKDNQKLGTSGNIDSNWLKMSYWRFGVSILFAFVGDILAGFGYLSLVRQISQTDQTLATVTAVLCYIGIIGGFFVHTVLCIQPVIYKKIMETNQFRLADDTLEQYYKMLIAPFFIGYGSMLAGAVCVIIAILTDALNVPKWFVLLNPIVFLIIGVSFRKIRPDKFYDLPGIIMPSLGLGMLGMIAAVSAL
ncbi:MAG: hypothetical protein K2H29_05115 [Oscillospiraceae bacterium]|nr:hypothetical protein [Oscillospiraceae bacterium]MDE5884442.1 hypothetical protein [Oscillospiraceae bacterium]